MLNLFAKLNNAPLRFLYSEELVDKSYTSFAKHDMIVIFPYDASQMRFYEFYAMGMPIVLPQKAVLGSYIYRGMTSTEDFDYTLEGEAKGHTAQVMPNPFTRFDYDAASLWSLYTHYIMLPHLFYFKSMASLLELLLQTQENLIAASAGMRRQAQIDTASHLRFWAEMFQIGEL